MSDWTRIHWYYNELPFERSESDPQEIVWLFYATKPEMGVSLGSMLYWERERPWPAQSSDEREYYFDSDGNLSKPSHWHPLITGEPKPEPPDISYLRCPDGSPHDWESTPMTDNEGNKIAGEPIVQCTKCGAYPDC